jgi:hypothetical protein
LPKSVLPFPLFLGSFPLWWLSLWSCSVFILHNFIIHPLSCLRDWESWTWGLDYLG